MLGILIILFIVLPLVDLVVLFQIGDVLTFWPTLALVIATGVGGAALAKHQGITTIERIQSELNAGRMPATELGEGVLILLAAMGLIVPGFITDVLGLLLLIRPIRRLFLVGVAAYFRSRIILAGGSTGHAEYTRVRMEGFIDDDKPSGAAPGDPKAGGMKYVRNEALDSSPAEDD